MNSKAAEEGHVPAMYQLGSLSVDPRERKRWLQESARHGSEAAIVELAQAEN